MELQMGNNGGDSGDEHGASNSGNKGKKAYHRHSSQQIQQLENEWKRNFPSFPHLDQTGAGDGVFNGDPYVNGFISAQIERSGNSVLRAENERIHCENLAIREAMKNVICPACGGPPFGEEERQLHLQKLRQENARLREEHENVSSLLARYIGKPKSQIALLSSGAGSSQSALPAFVQNQRMGNPRSDLERNPDMEKVLMAETAAGAMDELITLLGGNEPFWIKSPSDGRFILDQTTYDKIYPRAAHFTSCNARVESSKDSATVTMPGMDLVDMFLDPNKWVDLFPTIVTEARTIQVLQAGTEGNRHGSLQMMYEQMHILSPMVPTREFYFLRLCQQLEPGQWVIADVSYDYLKESGSPPCAWRLPSGCLIQDMADGFSKVIWVEHVEVDDRIQTHRLYRDLICGGSAYGAERWIASLHRICERLAFSTTVPPPELGGVVTSPEGRKSIANLAHRMMKIFCASLAMSGKLDFRQLSEGNNSGVRVAIRKNEEQGQPIGTVVSAATSFWLPLSPQNVFDFFKDEKSRAQWDILSNGNPVHEISRISNGADPGNCISIIQPFIPSENNMLILQESCTDSSVSMMVYAPVGVPAMDVAMSGEGSSIIPILPSGFVISGDGRVDIRGNSYSSTSSTGSNSGGSLLTISFQILVSGPNSSPSTEFNMKSVATVNTLISTTVMKIKSALNCSNFD
ncbi:hypothetical protein OIU85_007777 [Salix viminalis]|uniref:START domain-containing protein n=1 Tax=Salix viminalis TaxID=40686 RepID=A0A9Q0SP29_SALVM|nr:hypothetical protein OIU85_007777 [Salix viminalis]